MLKQDQKTPSPLSFSLDIFIHVRIQPQVHQPQLLETRFARGMFPKILHNNSPQIHPFPSTIDRITWKNTGFVYIDVSSAKNNYLFAAKLLKIMKIGACPFFPSCFTWKWPIFPANKEAARSEFLGNCWSFVASSDMWLVKELSELSQNGTLLNELEVWGMIFFTHRWTNPLALRGICISRRNSNRISAGNCRPKTIFNPTYHNHGKSIHQTSWITYLGENDRCF